MMVMYICICICISNVYMCFLQSKGVLKAGPIFLIVSKTTTTRNHTSSRNLRFIERFVEPRVPISFFGVERTVDGIRRKRK